MRSTLTWSAGLLPLAVLLASCNPSAGTKTALGNPPAAGHVNIIVNCQSGHAELEPWQIHVTHGNQVTWDARGTQAVTLTPKTTWPLSPSSVPIAAGASYPFTPSASFSYIVTAQCSGYNVVFDPDIVVD